MPHLTRKALTIVGTLAAAAVLVVVLVGKSDSFTVALHAAPLWLLALAAALQLLALLARTEAWRACVGATGASVSRRLLYKTSNINSLMSQINSQLKIT